MIQTLPLNANVMQDFIGLFSNVGNINWKMILMWIIGAVLVYLAIKKEMEPTLLLPMGFGTILVNLPLSGAIGSDGPLTVLFKAGIANELFPLLLFIGIGAMIDFGPLLKNPWLMLFGAAAQFGIFFTYFVASFSFDVNDAASIAIIGAADGPTSIFVANELGSKYLGAIMVAAYSYMALVPIVQPPVIKAVTTKKERLIRIHLQIFSQFFSVSPLHHKCIMRILLSRKHFLFSDSVLLRSSLIRLAVLFLQNSSISSYRKKRKSTR